MHDEPPPTPGDPEPARAPQGDPGPPSFARLDGILEGRLTDPAALRAAVARANAAGYGRLDLDVDGGRFTLLPDADLIPAAAMDDARRGAFFDGLAAAAATSSAPVESTLRTIEVFRDCVRESLFVASPDGGLRALTRERAATDADRAAGSYTEPEPPRMGRVRLAVVAALMLVLFSLIAWFGGWVDRVAAPGSGEIAIDRGVFGDMLDATVEGAWGDYEVHVKRGAGYPVTTAEAEERQGAARTTAERAAAGVVSSGGDVWVRIEAGDGTVLAASRLSLRPLIESAERDAETTLPGRMAGRTIRLALDDGLERR